MFIVSNVIFATIHSQQQAPKNEVKRKHLGDIQKNNIYFTFLEEVKKEDS